MQVVVKTPRYVRVGTLQIFTLDDGVEATVDVECGAE